MAEQTKVKSTENKQVKPINTGHGTRSGQAFKAVLLAFLVGIILVVITGKSKQLVEFLMGFWTMNFSDVTKFTDYLSRISYLVPIGLAVAVAFRMGLFNIGASGQALGGGAVAYWLGTTLTIGKFGWVVCMLVGVLFGMLIALIISFLKNNFRINEVISSIMINWMVFYIVIQLSANGVTSPNEGNRLNVEWLYNALSNINTNEYINASQSTNIGIIFILPLVIILAWAYKKTKWGYKQELIGNNPKTGSYVGINSKREIYKTMALSGALAGLAGVIYYLGYTTELPNPTTFHEIPGWTFDGITIALLGFSTPGGVLASSIIYGLFTNEVDTIVGNVGIVSIMVGVMILSIAASNYKILYGSRKGGGK